MDLRCSLQDMSTLEYDWLPHNVHPVRTYQDMDRDIFVEDMLYHDHSQYWVRIQVDSLHMDFLYILQDIGIHRWNNQHLLRTEMDYMDQVAQATQLLNERKKISLEFCFW